MSTSTEHHRVLVVGGGTGGITVAARLLRARHGLDLAIVEPADTHYYQPLWTLVGGGEVSAESTARPMATVIPEGATWIRDAATAFEPASNAVLTREGRRIGYDYLVVAPGIQIDWGAIPGLAEGIGRGGVCSNYSYQAARYTWDCLRSFGGGNAIFTQPNTAIKCGGAPQKIMYLAEAQFRRRGVRGKSRVIFATAGTAIFGIEKYRRTLERIVRERGIDLRLQHNLVAIRPEAREAVFERLDTGATVALPYAMLHVAPPMSAPDFLKGSPIADAKGWVDVDPDNLRHKRFPNIFGLGDASNLPTSKTGAAIRKQAPVLVAHLLAAMEGGASAKRYDGYSSCPIVTDYGKLMLAEFDYRMQPTETFPFDQSKERRSMYLMKKHLLPALYWHGMLKGRA